MPSKEVSEFGVYLSSYNEQLSEKISGSNANGSLPKIRRLLSPTWVKHCWFFMVTRPSFSKDVALLFWGAKIFLLENNGMNLRVICLDCTSKCDSH